MKINWKRILKEKIILKENLQLEPIIENNGTNKKSLIRVNNLCQSFGPKNVYQNVNLEIYEGEILAILGTNGAGKTSLVESIAGIIKPTSGTIEFLYKSNEKIGVQFQDLSFPNGFSMIDILNFIIDINCKTISEQNLSLMLEKFKLKEFAHTKVKKLSGGQQQRLNVLIAMISKPKVLFLDEFTTGLDIDVKNQIKNFIIEFIKKESITLVVISHDTDIIQEIAERIVVLSENKVMVDASRATLIKKFGSIPSFLKKYIV